ncbi:PREDICTED: uncharacterized protein LOC105577017 [Cercocebus atys]|uniref:uncharacterized protein LOC105577017 n=1 Tax=Cercocebus atys TaxID=9531 RepID=UPI0005F422C0|nr:PREDICTED: uncharacterized protein LOC105577017 [Cercocebus atys]
MPQVSARMATEQHRRINFLVCLRPGYPLQGKRVIHWKTPQGPRRSEQDREALRACPAPLRRAQSRVAQGALTWQLARRRTGGRRSRKWRLGAPGLRAVLFRSGEGVSRATPTSGLCTLHHSRADVMARSPAVLPSQAPGRPGRQGQGRSRRLWGCPALVLRSHCAPCRRHRGKRLARARDISGVSCRSDFPRPGKEPNQLSMRRMTSSRGHRNSRSHSYTHARNSSPSSSQA